MMGRKKRILIITLSILLVVFLVIGGILIYLNVATDTFKSNDELFYKYLYQNGSIANVIDTNLLDRYYQKIDNNAYNGSGELTIKTGNSDNSESDTKEFDDFINNLKLNIDVKSNLPDKKQQTEFKVSYKDQEQFKVNVIKNDNVYGFKSDEVVNKYLAVRNEELRDIYNKLGIQDADSIPNQFKRIDYNIYKNMNAEDKTRILSTYQNLLHNEISPNHYTKQSKVNIVANGQNMIANAYILTLSEQELATLKINILETLMEDELTLKYIVQFMQLDSNYTVKIKQQIQDKIDEIKREQIPEGNVLKITVYESNRQLITTKVETSDYNYSIDNNISGTSQKVTISKISNDGNNITSTLTLQRNTSDSQNSLVIEWLEKTGDTTTIRNALTVELDGNIESNSLNLNVKLENLDNNKMNEVNYTNKKEFTSDISVEELNNDNSVNVNTMNIEDLNSIYNSVIERIQYLYGEKVNNLGLNINNINNQGTLKWSRIVDAFDEDEFKAQVQRALNLAKDDLQNKEEYRTLISQAAGDTGKINQIKGLATVERLRETGLDATLNEEDNSISIKTNSESAHKYEIDFENFKISKIND